MGCSLNSSRLALGFVGVALAGLWYFAGGTQVPTTRAADAPPRVAAPLAHENLSVYFVHGPDAVQGAKVMSLQEALDQNLAVVHETSNVNQLAVENRSPDCELFIQSGDIVKGGKQDRMAATDMLLPPMSGAVALPAHCVEQGRWTNRGSEDAGRFKSSAKCAVGNKMKIANAYGQQGEVWKTVADNQGKLRTVTQSGNVNAEASPTSFQLTLEAPEVQALVTAYETALKARGEDRDTIIGVVFVVNGQITGAEVYGSNTLFRKAWPKLLNAAAVEAVADRTDRPTAQAPSAREVERFLARGAEAAGADGVGPLVATDDPVAFRLDTMNRSRRSGMVMMNDNIGIPQTPAPDSNIMGGSGAGRVQIEGRGTNGNRAAPTIRLVPNNDLDVVGGNQARGAVATNTDGNRLSSNRAENNSTLTVESRDPARKNAVIHKSYIKK